MTYKISSVKAGKTFTTKDHLKDAAWGNQYYGVDDCVVEVIQDPTAEEIAAKEQAAKDLSRLAEIDAICGPRAVREALLALGQKGYQNKIETLEAEAQTIRNKKGG